MFWWGWSIYDRWWQRQRKVETEDVIDLVDECYEKSIMCKLMFTEDIFFYVPGDSIEYVFVDGSTMTFDNYERVIAMERISNVMGMMRPGRKMYEDGKLTPIADDMDNVMDKAAQMCREMEDELWETK